MDAWCFGVTIHADSSPPGALPDTPEVRAALADPDVLLRAAHEASAGWSAPFGGPDGVALLPAELRRQLDDKANEVSALRSAAVAEMLRDRSLSTAGKILGIGKTAVDKINKKALDSEFIHLVAKGLW